MLFATHTTQRISVNVANAETGGIIATADWPVGSDPFIVAQTIHNFWNAGMAVCPTNDGAVELLMELTA